jgi:hypothetical protein
VDVFPDGLPVAEIAPEAAFISLQVTVTAAQSDELRSEAKPVAETESTSRPKPEPPVAPLRRQRSGTIMRPSTTGSLPVPPPLAEGVDLGRARTMVEARTQMFERTIPTRSQTAGSGASPRTLVRQKSATFERAKSLFHVAEEDGAQSEGSRTPPRPVRGVSKLDMSKFGFA